MSNIESLLDDIINFFFKKEKSSSKSNVEQTSSKPSYEETGFQAPIKGSFGNSGDFSPNAATDPRHPKGHKGVDLRASGGTSVYPITSGMVTNISSGSIGGNTVSIKHPNNINTYYAHLGTISVHKGDNVNKNTVIGTVGDSGNAAGTFPHVHFQVWQNGSLENPSKFFNVPKYSKPTKNEKTWLSDNHKQEAKSFNIAQHKAKVSKASKIEKIATIYENIVD
jgi:murein DD-endopeptidase MepM/ murein hydrolase activator NlpD